MRDFAQIALEASKNQMASDAPLVRILELTIPTDPPSVLRLANYDRDITWGNDSDGASLVWKRFPFSMGELRDTRQGDLTNLSVNISNVTRELMAYIDAYEGLADQSLTIRLVNTGNLAEPAVVLFAGDVVSGECDDGVAVFTAGSPKLAREVFPGRRVLTQCGVVKFGDAECGYVIPASPTNAVGGGFDFCPRSLAACRERGDDEVARSLTRLHPRRFDGAPGASPGNP